MNATQCRMARAALQIRLSDVAKLAKVATSTVARLEAGDELKPRTVEAVQRAFEAQGLEFVGGDAPGVLLHKGAVRRKKKP